MGGLAQLAQAAGHVVSGCDANVYPPMSDQLAAANVRVIDGYDADQLSLTPDVWVVGNVVTRGNPLMEAILDRGARYVSGPQWLSDHVLHARHVLAVAGTHGKTTTSAMLAKILDHAGLEPGFLIGGVPSDFGTSARTGGGRHFVVEADEYDTAFFDKRSKFLHYRSRTLVLNNLEFDHADIFPDLAAIETQFHHLVRTLPASARVIANAGDAAIERVLQRGCWSELEKFAAPDSRWRLDSEPPFQVHRDDHDVGPLQLALAGQHNRMNALAAIAAAHHAGVSPAEALIALAEFRGVKRRLEVRGVVDGVTVIDDFAHHPTAFAMTIAALRASHPHSRIVAVFEPRSNTMKRGVVNALLPDSLSKADRVFCYAGAIECMGSALTPLGSKATVHDGLDTMIEAIVGYVQPGDQLVFMSNGGFGGIHAKLLTRLAQRADAAKRAA